MRVTGDYDVVAIFFLAFLPLFAVEGAGPVSAQLFLHGTMITVVVAVVEPPLVLAGAKLGACFRQSRRASLWMDRGLGASFVALGARLAASTR